MTSLANLGKYATQFPTTNCFKYLTSQILSASQCGERNYCLPKDYVPINPSTELCKLTPPKSIKKLNDEIWKHSKKSSVYIPDTATIWYGNQRLRHYGYPAKTHAQSDCVITHSLPATSLVKGYIPPIRSATQQSLVKPTQYKRISPEFLDLLKKYDANMLAKDPLYGLPQRYIRRRCKKARQPKLPICVPTCIEERVENVCCRSGCKCLKELCFDSSTKKSNHSIKSEKSMRSIFCCFRSRSNKNAKKSKTSIKQKQSVRSISTSTQVTEDTKKKGTQGDEPMNKGKPASTDNVSRNSSKSRFGSKSSLRNTSASRTTSSPTRKKRKKNGLFKCLWPLSSKFHDNTRMEPRVGNKSESYPKHQNEYQTTATYRRFEPRSGVRGLEYFSSTCPRKNRQQRSCSDPECTQNSDVSLTQRDESMHYPRLEPRIKTKILATQMSPYNPKSFPEVKTRSRHKKQCDHLSPVRNSSSVISSPSLESRGYQESRLRTQTPANLYYPRLEPRSRVYTTPNQSKHSVCSSPKPTRSCTDTLKYPRLEPRANIPKKCRAPTPKTNKSGNLCYPRLEPRSKVYATPSRSKHSICSSPRPTRSCAETESYPRLEPRTRAQTKCQEPMPQKKRSTNLCYPRLEPRSKGYITPNRSTHSCCSNPRPTRSCGATESYPRLEPRTKAQTKCKEPMPNKKRSTNLCYPRLEPRSKGYITPNRSTHSCCCSPRPTRSCANTESYPRLEPRTKAQTKCQEPMPNKKRSTNLCYPRLEPRSKGYITPNRSTHSCCSSPRPTSSCTDTESYPRLEPRAKVRKTYKERKLRSQSSSISHYPRLEPRSKTYIRPKQSNHSVCFNPNPTAQCTGTATYPRLDPRANQRGAMSNINTIQCNAVSYSNMQPPDCGNSQSYHIYSMQQSHHSKHYPRLEPRASVRQPARSQSVSWSQPECFCSNNSKSYSKIQPQVMATKHISEENENAKTKAEFQYYKVNEKNKSKRKFSFFRKRKSEVAVQTEEEEASINKKTVSIIDSNDTSKTSLKPKKKGMFSCFSKKRASDVSVQTDTESDEISSPDEVVMKKKVPPYPPRKCDTCKIQQLTRTRCRMLRNVSERHCDCFKDSLARSSAMPYSICRSSPYRNLSCSAPRPPLHTPRPDYSKCRTLPGRHSCCMPDLKPHRGRPRHRQSRCTKEREIPLHEPFRDFSQDRQLPCRHQHCLKDSTNWMGVSKNYPLKYQVVGKQSVMRKRELCAAKIKNESLLKKRNKSLSQCSATRTRETSRNRYSSSTCTDCCAINRRNTTRHKRHYAVCSFDSESSTRKKCPIKRSSSRFQTKCLSKKRRTSTIRNNRSSSVIHTQCNKEYFSDSGSSYICKSKSSNQISKRHQNCMPQPPKPDYILGEQSRRNLQMCNQLDRYGE